MKAYEGKTNRIVNCTISIMLAIFLALGAVPLLGQSAHAAETAPQPNSNGRFTVYSNYFNYYPYDFYCNQYGMSVLTNSSTPLYMEYSSDGGKTWKRTGYMTCNYIKAYNQQGFKFGGLRPNTTYRTRIYYGDIYGNRISPYRNTTTIKTGQGSKPAIKSITAKAVNVKFHKTRRPGYYYWTGYHYVWIRGVNMRYYTYNVKVTVKLKKKPGTAGIWVSYNGQKKFLKGNKKKYTTKFKIPSPYNMSVKKPRKNIKGTVSVQTGQSASYGGYSPEFKKKYKLK